MRIPLVPSAIQAIQAVPRDGLSIAADVSMIIVAGTVVLLALVVAALLLRTYRLLREVRQHIGPVTERTRGIAENVEHITRSLRDDVSRVDESVRALTDRLKLASDRMEERIGDFNALMEVVQEEAEGVFIDTAATVRGVRAGARSLTDETGDGDLLSEPSADGGARELEAGSPEAGDERLAIRNR
ncbi:MAG: hypothetical protein AB7T31_07680 [Gemmatimonadales bacterium]